MAAQRGNFIWYDVMTSEPKAATSFYSDVIGWDAHEYPMEDRTYTVFRKGPVMVAGLMRIAEAMRATGIRPCWSGYVAVDDVDGVAVRILGVTQRAICVDVYPPAQHVLAVERERLEPQDLVDRADRRGEAVNDLVRNPDPHDWIRAASS